MSYATAAWMKHAGIPLTRENYIDMNWMEVPTNWDVECEMQLPPELRRLDLVHDRQSDEPMSLDEALALDEYDPNERRDESGEWTKGGGQSADLPAYQYAITSRPKDASADKLIVGTLKKALYPDEVRFSLYHATNAELKRGDFVDPGHPGNFVRRMKHVYAAERPPSQYGRNCYEVRPTGPIGHRADAREENGYWASESPYQVLRKLTDEERNGSVAHDAFNPDEPRGQPGNPGQWVKGAGTTEKRWANAGHIPRAQMPQVPSANIPEFKSWLQSMGIGAKSETVDPHTLKKTQEALNPAAVAAVAAALKTPDHNPKIDKPVLISRDGYILDGHHTWAGHMAAGMPQSVERIDLDIADLLEAADVFTGGAGKKDADNTPQENADKIISAVPGAKEKIDAVEARLAKGVPTDAPVDKGGFKTPQGWWTPERERLHQDIIRKVLTPDAIRAAVPEQGQVPLCVVLGGRGGSGKSWFTGPNGPVDRTHAIYINADDLMESLPGYQGWNAALYHEEASDLANMLEQRCRNAGLNVIHDATMRTWISAAARINAYQSRGYKVKSYFMNCTPETSALRAVQRFMTTGRYVPPAYLLSSVTNQPAFRRLRDFCDDWQEYDSENGTPVLTDQKAPEAHQ